MLISIYLLVGLYPAPEWSGFYAHIDKMLHVTNLGWHNMIKRYIYINQKIYIVAQRKNCNKLETRYFSAAKSVAI